MFKTLEKFIYRIAHGGGVLHNANKQKKPRGEVSCLAGARVFLEVIHLSR